LKQAKTNSGVKISEVGNQVNIKHGIKLLKLHRYWRIDKIKTFYSSSWKSSKKV